MKFQDYIIDAIEIAFKDAFKAARAVPEDKLSWKPLDLGRSVLDQAQELAQCPDYVTGMVKGEKSSDNDGDWDAVIKERQAWTTLDKCQEIANERLAALYDAIRACPDERLKETVWLPYDGGRDFTIEEIMDYPRWNANYHSGQINYIQTLYGDKEMH
jgi:uncharacterized damage-inducible protein DinB